MLTDLALSSLFCLAIGLGLFRAFIPIAHKFKLVDHPTSRRRHREPMPILGGVVVFLTWTLGIALFSVLNPQWFEKHSFSVAIIGVSIGILLLVGLADDLRGLGPKTKLFWQVTAASIVLALEPNVHAFCLHWYDRIGSLIWPIAILWIVGLSNAINLVDGLDGLAAGTALFVATSLGVQSLLWVHNGDLVMVMMVLLIPCLAMFLKYNWHPARIFLGDNGSLPLGFLIATLSMLAGPMQNRSSIQVLTIGLMMGYPILDMGLCVLRRYRNQTPLFKADRNHFHHRLLRLGLSPRQVCLLLLTMTFYLQVTALAISAMTLTFALLYLGAAAISLFALVFLLRGVESARTEKVASNHPEQVKKSIYQRRAVANIQLEPLLEAGLFEEKDRVWDLISSLKLMLQSALNTNEVVFLSNNQLSIIFEEDNPDQEQIRQIQKTIREKLTLFQRVYNVQYSLQSLPVDLKTQEFLVHPAA